MRCFLSLFFVFLLINSLSFAHATEAKNPYVPKKINVWIDKEFLEYCQDLAYKDYKSYSTDETEIKLIRQLIELLRLQLKTNLILMRQNEELMKLIKKNRK